ncbi:hypothetical protein ACFE04_016228 [Oxalis oulophora]
MASEEEDKVINNVNNYPTPLNSHQDVVNEPTIFFDTLRRFHFVMGTKFMVPVISGKELDLHVLYVEVTKRGGFEKVVADKKWREVGSVFMFSSTTTSASFVLRKHYFTLLFHYEQVYFFRLQGPFYNPTLTAAAALPVSSNSNNNPPTSKKHHLAMVKYSPKKRNFSQSAPPQPAVTKPVTEDPASFTAFGTIEGKFDCGYLVSVKLGSEILHGVLYHPVRPNSGSSTSQVPEKTPAGNSRRKKRRRKSGDPSYPKPNRSGYNFFFAEKHYKLKSVYPNREREFTKMIGESWTNLSPEERTVYQNIGLKDKERYKRELKEYKERLNLRQTTMQVNGA